MVHGCYPMIGFWPISLLDIIKGRLLSQIITDRSPWHLLLAYIIFSNFSNFLRPRNMPTVTFLRNTTNWSWQLMTGPSVKPLILSHINVSWANRNHMASLDKYSVGYRHIKSSSTSSNQRNSMILLSGNHRCAT